ncbi:MAG: GTP cyclohydrolase I [Gammaproteobacteria bacterium]|nr:GTP cyclohydrolase I [Gammaproteobacteria bacterium]
MTIEAHIAAILEKLLPKPLPASIEGTPKRYAEALAFLTAGYHVNLEHIFKHALFNSPDNSMVIVKDIEFYSSCEHHLLPFLGRCHIGYIPDGKILGLSKFGEIVDVFARRLQTQENLTQEIALCLEQYTHARGVAVVMEAEHLCMKMRGIQKQHPVLLTQSFLGELNMPNQQAIFFNLIQQNNKSSQHNR